MNLLIPIPWLAFGFVVLVGTIAGVTWLSLRRGPHLGDQRPVETQTWLRIPYLDTLFELPRRLPGMYRPIGTWIGTVLVLIVALCFVWERSGVALLLAVLSNYYAEQTMERGLLQRSTGGTAFGVTLLLLGVLMAMVHFALLMRTSFS